jgi:hypothetical protein
VELVVIDFGLSHKIADSAAPENTGHTKPFGTKYFLTESQRPRLSASSSDFFQALQLVMYLAIMRSVGGSGNLPKAITHGKTDYQGLGSLWLTQDKPWLMFVVTHEASCCDSLIHEIYCAPCCAFFADYMDEVAELDTWFSPLPATLRRALRIRPATQRQLFN